MEAFLDMHTVEERLRGERYISHTYRSQSGRWYCIILVAQSYDKNGKLTSILIAARDCTAEKESEQEQQRRLREAVEQTRRADAAKTDFLRRMSHDIRTPINEMCIRDRMTTPHSLTKPSALERPVSSLRYSTQ